MEFSNKMKLKELIKKRNELIDLILINWIDSCIASAITTKDARTYLKICKDRLIKEEQEIKNLNEEINVLETELNRIKQLNSILKNQVNALQVESEFE